MSQKQKVAIFDVDGTIFRSSLLIQVVNRLIEKKVFPASARRVYEKEYEQWLNREGDYEQYIDAVVRTFVKHLKGVHYSELADTAEEVVDEQWKRVYRYTRDLLKDLKKRGYFLLAVSHSPKTILDKFCPRRGFNTTSGMLYEIGPTECFTGNIIEQNLILNKAAVVRRAVEKEHLTLAHSIGVGDTESDISFLDMVAKPICFNPNAKLYRYAKRLDWNVVVERKDVIYQL